MSENFTREGNDTLEQQIKSADSPTALYEMLATHLAENRPTEASATAAANPPMPAEPVRHSPSGFFQVVYPSGNDRFEVSADSAEELRKKIEKIYSMYRR
ncbi:MAG: hypothetical protein WAN23_00675 [Candidatus Acidiferrales bacterium]